MYRGIAQELLQLPKCRIRQLFSEKFLTRYDTVEKLQSRRCRLDLFLIALVQRMEAIDLEAAHSRMRRLLQSRVQSSAVGMTEMCAKMYLAKERDNARWGWLGNTGAVLKAAKKQSGHIMKRPAASANAKKKRSAIKKKRGGGGSARAAFSELLPKAWPTMPNGKRKRLDKDERATLFSRVHAEVRRLKATGGDEISNWKKCGEAGTVSHRIASSFGRRRWKQSARQRKRNAQPASVVARLVEQVQQTSLTTAISLVRKEAKLSTNNVREVHEALRSWHSSQADVGATLPALSPLLLGNTDGHFIQPGCPPEADADDNTPLEIVEIRPPGQEMAEKLFAHCISLEHSEGCLFPVLRSRWSKLMDGYVHNHCKQLPKIKRERLTPCMLAGVCLHQLPHGQMADAIVQNLAGLFHGRDGLLKKGATLRHSYEAGAIVLRIFWKSTDLDNNDDNLWHHLGFGHLPRKQYTVLPLRAMLQTTIDEHFINGVSGGKALEVVPGNVQPMSLWKAVLPIAAVLNARPISKLDVEVWCLSTSTTEVCALQAKYVVVSRRSDTLKLWRPAGALVDPAAMFAVLDIEPLDRELLYQTLHFLKAT